jgi:iron complex outermembrane receptor protein
MLKTLIMKATFIALVGLISFSAHAIADTHRIDVPAGSLIAALESLAKQVDVDIVYQDEQVKGLWTAGVSGNLSPQDAVMKLLEGTPLQLRMDDVSRAMLITAPLPSDGPASSTPATQKSSAALPVTGEDLGEKKSFWDRFRLAQNEPSSPSDSSSSRGEKPSDNSSKSSDQQKLEEIIVTAQKRSERLQDVPVPVSAVNADTLVNRNQLRLEDCYTQIPALSLTTADPFGGSMIAIRGVTTGGYNNPTVGMVVDDVPYAPSTSTAYGWVAAEMDPSELARIEVLRGPQGTLYGASSMGGLLKYVTVDPSTDRVSGRLQGGLSSVHNGDEVGYSFRGSINVPLSEAWAVRASGFTRRDPGYIDDSVHGIDGVNRTQAEGGRLSALWRPSQDFSLKLSAMLEHSDANGSALVDTRPGFGDLQQSTPPGWGGYRKTLQVYSANLQARLGRLDLTAASAYIYNKNTDLMDFTAPFSFFGPLTETFFGVGVTGTTSPAIAEIKKFTQEIRLSTPLGEKVEWLLGAFYTHEDAPGVQRIQAADFNTGAVVGDWLSVRRRATLAEYAVFTDLTFRISDRFDVQIGGRESQNKQTYSSTQVGPYNLVFGFPDPNITPQARSQDSSFTYLVTPRFKVSPALMVYARVASGYRPGGPNPGAAFGLPSEYGPDKTQNFEIGVKGDAFDHALSFDASLYYIDWQDIQLQLFDQQTAQGYFANGGRAKSQGAELSIESRPLTGLTVAAWVAWNDAVLTADFPAGSTSFGADGDRLPTSSQFSGNFSLEQEFSLIGSATGFLGGSVSYVGDREGPFSQSAQRQAFPAYAKVDLRAGVRYDSWTVNLFANNVADKRALLTGGIGAFYPNNFTVIQPRAVGLSIARTF